MTVAHTQRTLSNLKFIKTKLPSSMSEKCSILASMSHNSDSHSSEMWNVFVNGYIRQWRMHCYGTFEKIDPFSLYCGWIFSGEKIFWCSLFQRIDKTNWILFNSLTLIWTAQSVKSDYWSFSVTQHSPLSDSACGGLTFRERVINSWVAANMSVLLVLHSMSVGK